MDTCGRRGEGCWAPRASLVASPVVEPGGTRQGGGGLVAKSGRPQIQLFYQNFRSLDSVQCANRQHLPQQITNDHLTRSLMFLNCLLLDLTVIDLMFMVHMDKIWVEIAKNFEMRTSGGGGGGLW